MHHPTDRITHTTAFVTPVVEHWLEREIAQWVHPMKDRSDDPSHDERTLLPQSYISLLLMSRAYTCSAGYKSNTNQVTGLNLTQWQHSDSTSVGGGGGGRGETIYEPISTLGSGMPSLGFLGWEDHLVLAVCTQV